jgi:hypothetical protein
MIAQGRVGAQGIAVDAESVYWIDTLSANAAVRKAPKAGGPVTDLVSPGPFISPPAVVYSDLVLAGDRLYWAFNQTEIGGTDVMLFSVPTTGGLSVAVLSESIARIPPPPVDPYIRDLIADATHIYYTTGEGLFRVSRAGGMPEPLVREITAGGQLAQDAQYVYVASSERGALLRISKLNSELTGLTPAEGLSPAPTALDVDEMRVYFRDAASRIRSVPKGGGKFTTLYTEPGEVPLATAITRTLLVRGGHVYFPSSRGLTRIDTNGGGLTVLHESQPSGLAADDRYIYWTAGDVWRACL